MQRRAVVAFVGFLLMPVLSGPGAARARQEPGGPETFVATAQVKTGAALSSATVTIALRRYTEPRNLTAMQEALRLGGYSGLLPVLRKMPDVGSVELSSRTVAVRWARQTPTNTGRSVSIVTDQPLFFVGGGAVDAKPRTGFELAVILLELDAQGQGTGTMAPAARVRPGGAAGVQIDDYAEEPVALTSVRTVTP